MAGTMTLVMMMMIMVFYGGDDNSESPRDYAACTLDDCGYCRHCPY